MDGKIEMFYQMFSLVKKQLFKMPHNKTSTVFFFHYYLKSPCIGIEKIDSSKEEKWPKTVSSLFLFSWVLLFRAQATFISNKFE